MKKGLKGEIPRQAVYRLSVYMRCLMRLKANGLETVSSQALSSAAGVKPTQLRKDLTYFGQFGTRGLGYDVKHTSEVPEGTDKTDSTAYVSLDYSFW